MKKKRVFLKSIIIIAAILVIILVHLHSTSCLVQTAEVSEETIGSEETVTASEQPESEAVVEDAVLYNTGSQPKQVLFSPDGSLLIIPLLKGPGFNLISLSDGKSRLINVPGYAEKQGFVEAVFCPSGERFYVSQMTTGMIHVFTSSGVYKKSFSSGGKWTKVMALSPDGSIIAVSNWLSNSITVLNPETGEIIHAIQSQGTEIPRGLAFSPDGGSLVAAFFGSGDIVRYSARDWSETDRIHTGGADRHVVIHPHKPLAYISNMASRRVHVLSLKNNRVIADIPVGSNPNTIELNSNGSRLYVSCRGLNNPDNYTLPGPEDGEVYVIDTETLETVKIIPGGKQPTGLDVSADDKYLAFTNFQDNTVELHRLF